MDTTAFRDIDIQSAQIAQRQKTLRATLRTVAIRRRKQRMRFDLLILAALGVFFIVFGLLVDYLFVLNDVLARIDLWIMLTVTVVILARCSNGFLLTPLIAQRDAQRLHSHLTQQYTALYDYKNGTIDPVGIRALYSNAPHQTHRHISEKWATLCDWGISMTFLLGIILFALIFA